MIWHPKVGQRVTVWYAKKGPGYMGGHGKNGAVLAVGSGAYGPINALVRLDDGREFVVTQGNLIVEAK